MDFVTAFHKLLGHEGDYSDHPSDPGGKTRWGVTEAVARANGYMGDMRDFPVETAQAIYKRSYWDAVKADELPAGIRFDVFDAAVNSGVGQAIRWLQQSVGTNTDGILGQMTMRAAHEQSPDGVRRRFNGYRLTMMANSKNWPVFGRGWAIRVAQNLLGA